MPNITPSVSIDLEKELGKLEQYKYHPNGIMQVSLNRLQDMLAGKVTIMEPSNPFTYLLETNCLNTAFAVQEFAMLTRKLYPRLANTDSDIYLHMSDYDYLGRFSEPSYANVTFNILMNDFMTNAYLDPVSKERTLSVPRHFKVMVGDYVYLMNSAVVIRLSATGVLDVRFENQGFNNIFPVTTNHINYNTYKVNNDEEYLGFSLVLPEVDIEVNDVGIDSTAINKSYLVFNNKRKFYHLRAFYKKNDAWKEMLVTHTNEVYDINTPTCIIKVLASESQIEYHIPTIYVNSGKMESNVRLLLYTTMGFITASFTDYKISDFTMEYGDVFPETEIDKYSAPIHLVSKMVFIKNSASNGKDGLSFEELKQSVIDNSIGDRKLPITTKQLEFFSQQKNFKIIKDVDVVTNRIYKLETEIPSPTTRYPVTKFNLDIIEYCNDVQSLREGNSVIGYGNDITVIPEGTLFRLENGLLSVLSSIDATQLKELSGSDLAANVNNNAYLYTYFHYVLDTSDDRTRLRVYDINTPSATQINFKTFNDTAKVSINSVTSNLYKTTNGYTLDVLCNLKKLTETISESNIRPYLVYTDVSGSMYYLISTLYTTINNQPVYRFLINTGYYINSDNRIAISNFRDSNGSQTTVFLDLSAKLELLYVSNVIPPLFAATLMDTRISSSYLYGGNCAVTLEEVGLVFGLHLERFFSGAHSVTSANDYERHTEDVVMRYKSTVYDSNNQVIHSVGEVVLDVEDHPVIEFAKGSVKLSDIGEPVKVSPTSILRALNLLFIDYKVTLSSDQKAKDYAKQIRNHITTTTMVNAKEVQTQLLDNTEAFVVVPKTVGFIRVKTPSAEFTIRSAQRFVFTLLVHYDVFNNTSIRDNISYTVVKMTDDYLHSANILKRSELLNSLYTAIKEFIVSMSIDQFTELNSEYIEILDTNGRVTIEKVLINEPNGYVLKENIDISFKLID